MNALVYPAQGHSPAPPTGSFMVVRAQLVLRVFSLLPTTDARLLGVIYDGDLS